MMDKFSKRDQSENFQTGPDNTLQTLENLTPLPARIPDLLDLSRLGFGEGELRQFLRLRYRYQKADSEITDDVIRLNFARFLFEQGKISI